MRKSSKLILVAGTIAALAVPSIASADVPRYEASITNGTTITAGTTITTAKFTVLQPKDTVGQFTNVWRHEVTVVVNADNTFKGTSEAFDNSGTTPAWTEDVTGSFNADKTLVSFDTTPNAGATFSVVNAPMDGITPVIATSTWTQNIVEFIVSKPTITTDTTTTPGIDSVKNHGQYVKAMGGGKAAAQDPAGMPLNSAQGK